MINHIQTHILKRLIASPAGFRYRDMKPAEIENDLYNYHLQYLVKNNLISKHNNYYELTDEGKKFILDVQPIDIRHQAIDKFKLAAICLVTRHNQTKTEILYQTRTCQPFVGTREMPGGSIGKGEPIVAAAKRRLFEETGLAAEFRHLGAIRKIRTDAGEVYSDIEYHICLANEPTGQLIEENEFGRKEWVGLDEVIAHQKTAPYGSNQLAAYLDQHRKVLTDDPPFFYFEETCQQSIY